MASSGESTKEYRTIQRHYSILVDNLGKTVDPAHFARKLQDETLISREMVAKASVAGVLTGTERITPAIDAVLAQIKLKANVFHTFVSVLKAENSRLADTISEYYTSSLELHALGVLESVSEWKELGHQLNIDPEKLLQLSQCGRDPEYCREQVVSEWLKGDKGASWEKLCRALERMGSEAQVLKIQQQYTCTSDDTPAAKSSEEDHTELDIAEQVDEFEGRFADFTYRLQTEMEEKEIPMKKFRHSITRLPQAIQKEHLKFIQDSLEKIHQAKDIEELFMYLNLYWTFFDYNLLQHFAKSHGSKELKEDVQKYAKDMEVFQKKTTVGQLLNVCPNVFQRIVPPPTFTQVVIKLERNASQYTLEELEQFRRRLCSELSLPTFILKLASLEEGSIIIIWHIPSSEVHHFHSTTIQWNSISTELVQLQVDGLLLEFVRELNETHVSKRCESRNIAEKDLSRKHEPEKMVESSLPGVGDKKMLHPSSLIRSDSGYVSPFSPLITPVPTPQSMQEVEPARIGLENSVGNLMRQESYDHFHQDQLRPRVTTVNIQAEEFVRPARTLMERHHSLVNMHLDSSYHFHRDQLTRAGIGSLPDHMVAKVSIQAEEIVSHLEQEEPFDLENSQPVMTLSPISEEPINAASSPTLAPISIPSEILSPIPEESNTPSSLKFETDKMLCRKGRSMEEVTYPKQDILCDLDRNYLTPGRDGYYFENRDYSLQGEGEFGTCVYGLDFSTQNTFMMKCNRNEIESICSECHMMEKLGFHDNVIQFFGAIIDDYSNSQEEHHSQKVCKMIVELAENGSLSDMLVEEGEPASLPIDQSLYYLQQILQGVNYLHTKSIVHLGIEGANILVFNEGQTVKLADFSSALHMGDKVSLKRMSPYWSAPEVIQEHQPTFSADIWSVMCVLVEMLTAKLPGCFQFQRDQTAMIFMIGHYTDDQIEQLIPYKKLQLDEGVVDLFMCVFKRNPQERPAAWDLLQHPYISNAYKYEKFFDIDYDDDEEEEEEEEKADVVIEKSFNVSVSSDMESHISSSSSYSHGSFWRSDNSTVIPLSDQIHKHRQRRTLSSTAIPLSGQIHKHRQKKTLSEQYIDTGPDIDTAEEDQTPYSLLHPLPVHTAMPLSSQSHYPSPEAEMKPHRWTMHLHPHTQTQQQQQHVTKAEGRAGFGESAHLRKTSLGEKGKLRYTSEMEIGEGGGVNSREGVMHMSKLGTLFTSHPHGKVTPSPLPNLPEPVPQKSVTKETKPLLDIL